MRNIISIENISKQYNKHDAFVLKNASLSVVESEFVALIGPSGSGKSTLLHIAGLIDTPTHGKINIENKYVEKYSDDEKTKIRLSKIGFVYQYHHLLQEFCAIENVMLPQLIAGVQKKIAYEKSRELLNDLGLEKKIKSMPSELSGGQRQRIAIARAVSNDPIILLADEPTGNLDHETAMLVFDDLLKMMQLKKMSMIVATHNDNLVAKTCRTYHISDGHLLEK